MTVLHSVDFFPSGKAPVAIEPRLPQFALDAFCQQEQCSERVLRQQFRAQTGMTINQYLRQVRICHAQYLLQHSPLMISEISMQCGFEDSNYFSVVFTRETGMTPSQWRHLSNQSD